MTGYGCSRRITSYNVYYTKLLRWRLIAVPQSLEEAIAVYQAAFPGTDRQTLEIDLRAALRSLADRGLAVVVP